MKLYLYQCIDPNRFVVMDDDEGVYDNIEIGEADFDKTDEEKYTIAMQVVKERHPDWTAL
jgi:hypothetical protein